VGVGEVSSSEVSVAEDGAREVGAVKARIAECERRRGDL
jgi:hypothetical protein